MLNTKIKSKFANSVRIFSMQELKFEFLLQKVSTESGASDVKCWT